MKGIEELNIPEDCRFDQDHTWVKVEYTRTRIGITDYAQDLLNEIIYVELHVHIGFMSVATYGALIKPGGGLRALAVFDNKRNTNFPDIPTAKERGYDIVLASWFGLQGPKGLPIEVKEALIQAFERTTKDPVVSSSLTKIGFNLIYLRPEEQEKKIQEEYKLYLDTWGKAGFIKK